MKAESEKGRLDKRAGNLSPSKESFFSRSILLELNFVETTTMRYEQLQQQHHNKKQRKQHSQKKEISKSSIGEKNPRSDTDRIVETLPRRDYYVIHACQRASQPDRSPNTWASSCVNRSTGSSPYSFSRSHNSVQTFSPCRKRACVLCSTCFSSCLAFPHHCQMQIILNSQRCCVKEEVKLALFNPCSLGEIQTSEHRRQQRGMARHTHRKKLKEAGAAAVAAKVDS